MNRLAKLAFVVFSACPALLGQERNANDLDYALIIIKHRDPVSVANTLGFLHSGHKDAFMQPSTMDADIKVIAVKDFPENIAMIRSSIEKLDVPVPKSIPINLRIDVIWASQKELTNLMPSGRITSHLSDVVANISKTLNYKYFSEAATTTSVVTNNYASGTMFFGFPWYSSKDVQMFKQFIWNLAPNTNSTDSDHIVSGKFNMQFSAASMSNVNIELKDKEKVILGTTIGDLAMIVVVSAERL